MVSAGPGAPRSGSHGTSVTLEAPTGAAPPLWPVAGVLVSGGALLLARAGVVRSVTVWGHHVPPNGHVRGRRIPAELTGALGAGSCAHHGLAAARPGIDRGEFTGHVEVIGRASGLPSPARLAPARARVR